MSILHLIFHSMQPIHNDNKEFTQKQKG